MQRSFGDQGIVVLLPEPSRCLQCARQYAHSLELQSAVADAVFVDGECLSEELVGELLEAALVCNLAAGNEEP